ncbi:hypothetical protein M4578_15485 [Salipiger sp. P9]|uniref:hypothetical protein n=1 Tax=Salipiger pentaromativorans TaxID=2943193 RepID=UPI00215858ED|nr:hypothetical protein [Salipiger pentaromativorans]MCR8549240.1 hypothetical protein [Salipiger pentaromativorans]
METKYPNINLQLSGVEGNALAILARCAHAARKAGLDRDQIARFRSKATSGYHDDLIQVALRWLRFY